jgi:anti-sigma regulatory factor (Ser/Thr protein kinase)
MQWYFQAACGSEALAARRSFVQFLQDLGVRQSDRYCAEMVFGELVGNAVRHAPGPIDIAAHMNTHDVVVLEIRDTGPDFALSPRPPPLHSECGRGLYIVSLLTTDLRSENTGFGNKVTAILHMTEPVGERKNL